MDKMWKMMKKRKIIFLDGSPNERCIICQNIPNDAYVSPCQCIFCKDCIQQHLTKGLNICPGNKEICPQAKLVLNKNVCSNHKLNKIIAKSLGKCPSYDCSYHCEMRKLWDHVKTCERVEMSCPYKEMGCSMKLTRKSMMDHISTEVILHNKLLTKWNKNKEHQRSLALDQNFKDLKMLMEENIYLISNCYIQEIKKHGEDMDNFRRDLSDARNKNDELRATIALLQNNVIIQNKEISDLKRMILTGKGNFSRKGSINEDSKVDIIRKKSHKTIERSSSTISDRTYEYKKSTNDYLQRRKNERRFSDFVNSFN